MKSFRNVEILLAEDDPADIELVRQAAKAFKIINNLSVVNDGEELLKFLRKEAPFETATTPDLIILDLNMPRVSGLEALLEIRKDPKLTHFPVVVMTSSDNDRDVLESYRMHANCYITKPVDMRQFEKIVVDLEHFWFSIVVLPRDSTLIP